MDRNYIVQILGTSDPVQFVIGLGFGLLGVFVSLLLHASVRDVDSAKTPVGFSWVFLFWDNFKRLILSLVLLFVGIRFAKEMIGLDNTVFSAFIIGLCLDKYVAQPLKERLKKGKKNGRV